MPFGRLVDGKGTLSAVYAGYRDVLTLIRARGDSYLKSEFPRLSYITHAQQVRLSPPSSPPSSSLLLSPSPAPSLAPSPSPLLSSPSPAPPSAPSPSPALSPAHAPDASPLAVRSLACSAGGVHRRAVRHEECDGLAVTVGSDGMLMSYPLPLIEECHTWSRFGLVATAMVG